MGKLSFSLCFIISILLVLGVPALAHTPPVDTTPPVIAAPIIQPSQPTYNNPVTVSVNVTDNRSVQNVTIVYTTDDWKTVNATVTATYDSTTTTATAQIPAQTNGGHVAYYIVAFDISGNRAVNNNQGTYFNYDVSAPPISSIVAYWAILAGIVGGVGAFAFILLRTIMKRSKPGKTGNRI